MTRPSEVRVWADGCFDMVHYGHANFLRKCSKLGDSLIVGVHSDEEIAANKGPPVFTASERLRIARAIKWVDEVYADAPLTTSVATLDKYNCDFGVHGDDVSINALGEDTFATVKAAGRYREVKRTAGVSTTDLVGRMLLATKGHFKQPDHDPDHEECLRLFTENTSGGVAKFDVAKSKIAQASSCKKPGPEDKVIYVSGSFDLFHIGHVDFLEMVSNLYPSTFVIVGLHSDQEVNRYRGENNPIMNLHERTLSVLACRYVNEVLVGAPYTITEDMLDYYGVDLVVHGATKILPDEKGNHPFACAKKLGKFQLVDTGNKLNTETILNRIIENRQTYIDRNKRKEKVYAMQKDYKDRSENK